MDVTVDGHQKLGNTGEIMDYLLEVSMEIMPPANLTLYHL
jgi:hypothetical protein